MRFAGLAEGWDCMCPLTQDHLADALGLTSIHINRVLRRLREEGLAALSKGRLRVADPEKLERVASFDGDYLDQGV